MRYKRKSKSIVFIATILMLVLSFGVTFTETHAMKKNIPPNKTTKPTYDIIINIEKCNAIILKSSNNKFEYDYDKSFYTITSKTKDNLTTIEAKLQSGKKQSFDFNKDDRIRIYVPDYEYDNVKVIGKHAGVSVVELDANLNLTNDKGAMSIYLSKDFNKKLDYTITNGSGALKIGKDLTNYHLKVIIESSSLNVADVFLSYDHDGSYEYKLGNGKAPINLNIKNSAFAIESYSDNVVDLLTSHYDIIF